MRLSILAVCLLAGASHAEPRSGANHRLGDDSFVAAYGRAPTGDDAERTRMATHLKFVRAELAAKPATRPELAAKRTQLLGYLDDYIAKGTTPQNTRLPWRSPVFIDDFGNICAVGYLIERSVGRDVAETIAAKHRFDYLEDIAQAMPAVRHWIDASGFTIDELASIQPGYEQPMIEEWRRWPELVDGDYRDEQENGVTTGKVVSGKMHGAWQRVDEKGIVVGKGRLRRGRGTWTSFYPDGKKLAEGAFESNHPNGAWTFFHASGRVAARGAFRAGHRHGAWKFFHDDKAQTPIAIGRFHRGSVTGTWQHFDTKGELLATSAFAQPPHVKWETGFLLSMTRAENGVRHEVHRLGGPDYKRLDGWYLGDEKLFVHDDRDIYDANGLLLAKTETGWSATDCGWSTKRKDIAQRRDITTLHGLLVKERSMNAKYPHEECRYGEATVSRDRVKQLDALHAAIKSVRAPTPDFVKKLALGDDADDETREAIADMPRLLAANMAWYIEWPHVDGLFVQVFYTLAGHSRFWESPPLE